MIECTLWQVVVCMSSLLTKTQRELIHVMHQPPVIPRKLRCHRTHMHEHAHVAILQLHIHGEEPPLILSDFQVEAHKQILALQILKASALCFQDPRRNRTSEKDCI